MKRRPWVITDPDRSNQNQPVVPQAYPPPRCTCAPGVYCSACRAHDQRLPGVQQRQVRRNRPPHEGERASKRDASTGATARQQVQRAHPPTTEDTADG